MDNNYYDILKTLKCVVCHFCENRMADLVWTGNEVLREMYLATYTRLFRKL